MAHKVLFPFVGTWFGGSHDCTLALVAHLDQEAYPVSFALHDRGVAAEVLDSAGHDYAVLPRIDPPDRIDFDWLAYWFEAHVGPAVEHILVEGIDIVHVTECPASEIWALAAAIAGRPVVWHVHGPPSYLMTNLPSLAQRYVCVSRFGLGSLPEHLRDGAAVIPNAFEAPPGIDRTRARERLSRELGLGSDVSFIGFCGRLSDSKRPDLFIEAAARIAKTSAENITFVLLGDDRAGQVRDYEARARALGLGGRCFFLGYRRDAVALMAGFEILLVPAIGEAFGRVLVEAMSVGTAVVASDSGGHGEIIENGRTGILAAAGDSAAMADGAVSILDLGIRDVIVENARAQAARYYQPRQVAARVEAVYRDVLAAPRPPAAVLLGASRNELLRKVVAVAGARAWWPALWSRAPIWERVRFMASICGTRRR